MQDNKTLSSFQGLDKIESEDNPELYFEGSRRRRWELSYGGKDKFYLTDQERNAFLNALSKGANKVQVGEMTLSAFFKYLIPIYRRNGLTEQASNVPNVPKQTPEQMEKSAKVIAEIKKKLANGFSMEGEK